MKKFSIIIATYNASATLQKCIDSIRPQKDEKVELLVIDGGSTDSTMEIIESNKDLVNYYIHEKDRGIYDAWNKGIKASQGEWILFLGADDTLCPDAIQKYTKFLSTLKDPSIEYISARVNYMDSSGKKIKVIGETWSWPLFSKEMKIAHVASLHSRKLFQEIGTFDLKYKICGDYELLLRKKERLKTAYLNEIVANMGAGGMSMSIKAIDEACAILNLHINKIFLPRLYLRWNKYIHYFLFLLKTKIFLLRF